MPFSLKNAPPTFQRYMTLIMNECADCYLVYMDDLLVFSETCTDHTKYVIRVFDTLMKAKLKVQMSKCVFGTECVEFFGTCHFAGAYRNGNVKKESYTAMDISFNVCT